ncbi:MAG: DUF92 domain-containing protein [Candidatus Eremiobacteraeota bacterium]|nr:DUF92 domain-containing protein [Candidatus Eremiobacteraeota bacterium]
MTQLELGTLLAAVVGITACRARALTAGGAAAAFVVGTIVFGGGGWRAALVLFAFFIPSTLLSRWGHRKKRTLGKDVAKQGARDAWQVLANGGVAAVCVLVALRGFAAFAAAFAGAFAAASADTWGTEIGTLSRAAPRSVLTLRPIRPGFSGGVTILGIAATAGGAILVAGVAAGLHIAPFWAVLAGGVAGATLDSVLGAGAQALRWCPACARECETDPHYCGSPTDLRRGVAWLGNDAVNLAATLCGAAVAGLLA